MSRHSFTSTGKAYCSELPATLSLNFAAAVKRCSCHRRLRLRGLDLPEAGKTKINSAGFQHTSGVRKTSWRSLFFLKSYNRES